MKRVYLFILIAIVFCLLGCNKTIISSLENEQSLRISYLDQKIDSLEHEIARERSKTTYANFEPGKVYLQCPINAQFVRDTVIQELIYTGKDYNQEGVIHKSIQVKSSYTKWVQVDSENLCDPENKDCIAWHNYEYPAEFRSIYAVTDTNLVKDFKIDSIELFSCKANGSLTEFKEQSCPTECFTNGNNLPLRVQLALKTKGYNLEGSEENRLDEITKSAIVEFQKNNGLEVGQLNAETLKALGVF